MAGTKRPFEDDHGEENVHPARKPRMGIKEPSADQKELNRILRKLGEEVSEQRIEATKELLKYLAEDETDSKGRVDRAVTRLVNGVCSGAKAARLGFSMALAEVLRFARDGKRKVLSFEDLLSKISALTPETTRGQEERDYLLGRMYAYHAILQSDVLRNATEAEVSSVFDAIAELAPQKEWLRNECGLILMKFLRTPANADLVLSLIASLDSRSLLKSPEGVALWLTAKDNFESIKLPKKIWHHRNPLSSQDRGELTRILLKNAVESKEIEQPQQNGEGKKKIKGSGARQSMPSFAWSVILQHLYKTDDGKDLAQFWEDCVAKPMFSANSSAERKSLGLQIFSQAIKTAPAELLGDVVHSNIVRCIVDQRSKSDRTLFAAAAVPLNTIKAQGQADATAAAEIVSKLLEVAPANLDKLTRQTVDNLLAASDPESLVHVVKVINDVCRTSSMLPTDAGDAEKKRRLLADAQLSIIRSRRSQPEQFFKKGEKASQWLKGALRNMTDLAYNGGDKISPALDETTRTIFRDRLLSALGHLVSLPIDQATIAPLVVLEKLETIERSALAVRLNDPAIEAIQDAQKTLKKAATKAESKRGSKATIAKASVLLLSLGILQVYKQEDDSVEVLKDITDHYKSKQSEDSSLLLVELLLSFVAKPSALLRKLAEQVFAAFAPEITADGLQSMISVLEPKESLAGKRELFKGGEEEDEEDDEDEDEDEASDVEMEDVEDASDVEIVNGTISGAAEEDDSASSSSDEDAADGANEDEEAEFDRKLADALGTVGMDGEEDSDEHGSDMDDDQMMAITPHLETIFKERKKGSSNKQDNKDAKEDVVNLKNRVLDLLSIYVKSQHANPVALDLLLPLITLTRTTTSQPTAQKAMDVLEAYFDTSKKQKSLPAAGTEDLFKVLSNIFDEIRLGGSKIHSLACSRSAQFLAKLLVATDSEGAWKKINSMYGDLQHEARTDAKTKIPKSVFNDWHNWSMQY